LLISWDSYVCKVSLDSGNQWNCFVVKNDVLGELVFVVMLLYVSAF